jgi:uncharacterized protein (TIGR02147 family)
MASNVLNIFDFSDYRKFIRLWLEKAKAAKLSNLSRLAAVAGVHPTFLSHVLSGSKELSPEQAALIGDHIGLGKLEKDYFFAILNLNRAGNQNLRRYWRDKKQEIETEKNKLSQRFDKHRELTDERRAVFYSSWIYAAVWSATAIDGGQTLAQIRERFQISRDRAEAILSFLAQVGLCHESKGLYSIGETHVHVPNESPFVVKHHINWRMKAVQRLDNRESVELFFTAPMSIAKRDFEVIRERINVAIKDIVDVAKDSPAEDVVCLNIDFFRAG